MYKAIESFIDGESGKPLGYGSMYGYNPGDDYPNGKYDVSDEHIKYLLGSNTSRGRPMIAMKEKPKKEAHKKEAAKE